MATGKARGIKRASGTSYSSTFTTIIFVSLCILGMWLLVSNPLAPLQSLSQAATKTPAKIQSVAHSRDPRPPLREAHPIHEDVPGEPLDDAIKLVDPGKPNDDAQKINQETRDRNENDSLYVKGQESLEEQEKQRVLETQTSEESSMTQNREVERVVEQNRVEIRQPVRIDDDKGSNEKAGDFEEIKVEKSSRDKSPKVTETRTVTDEEQERRIDEHQKDEDDQIEQGQKEEKSKRNPEGAISDDQIQHDEEPINNSDTNQPKHPEVKHISDEVSIPKESRESKKSWSTQEDESEDQKERRGSGPNDHDKDSSTDDHKWRLCNEKAVADYIPCLDNEKVIAKIHNRKHHEHRERHCPKEPPTCLVPLPKGYKRPIGWPQSRDKIWYPNVPHTSLADMKGHQNWVKVTGEFITFPGGGTQFIHGALHYIDFLQEAVPDISWGKHTRVVLDVGCGVASFGGYLFDRDVLTMSFAPKDEHEAQVQFALERGIPAISAVMGSQRLPFPSRVFDLVHCARCRVPWHEDGGALLLELNRVLRPGGYFVWSATPVYQKLEEDVKIWREMSNLTVAMCWELVTIKNDKVNSIGAAIYQKPDSNDCYDQRKQNRPPMCEDDDDPNAAWYVPLRSCLHRVPLTENERGSQWPEEWPDRLQTSPYWLNKSQIGIYGKPSPNDFTSDYTHWKKVVKKSYINGLGISWSNVRNVMDMRAVYGGFAAAMMDLKVWVMNVVNVDSPDTLPIIYERGLFGMYHDWCESFSTYPRTYDLLHANHLFSNLKKRCKLVGVVAEIDRLVRPGGTLLVRDEPSATGEIKSLLKSLHWDVHLNVSSNQERILRATKSSWRPDTYAVRS